MESVDNDLSSCKNKSCATYIKQIAQEVKNPKSLSEIFSGFPSKYVQILEAMLTFDPKKRSTAEQLLRDPIFNNIRNKKQESGSSVKVDLSADQI